MKEFIVESIEARKAKKAKKGRSSQEKQKKGPNELVRKRKGEHSWGI